MKTMIQAVLAISLVAVAAPAFAKGGKGTPQNHHCMKDGSEVAGVTKKECKKQGGKWEKGAAAPAAGAATGGAAGGDAAGAGGAGAGGAGGTTP